MWFPICSLTFATIASCHGIITSPTARSAGSAMKAVCGQQVTSNLQSNEYGDIQQLSKIGASQDDFDAYLCDVSLCKGLQFDDNTANVQKFTLGQVVPIKVDIQAKHTGTANVSVVDTATNKMISDELIYKHGYRPPQERDQFQHYDAGCPFTVWDSRCLRSAVVVGLEGIGSDIHELCGLHHVKIGVWQDGGIVSCLEAGEITCLFLPWS
jgi:hypothetical protein